MKWLCFSSGSMKEDSSGAKSSSSQSRTNTSMGSSFPMSSIASATSIESVGRPTTPSQFSSFDGRQNLKVFRFSELKEATNNFHRSLYVGEGGFGCVYRGMIANPDDAARKLRVAIKQLGKRGQGHKEWTAEVNVLGIVEHPNLVKLIGYCAEDDERGMQRLLVYEFMPNKSVADHLSARSEKTLSWPVRLRIALDAARGLTYLNEEMDFQIIFRDFKTSNILLDEQWNAKLSDFGMAREGPAAGASHVSTAVVGTMGYAAPEYVQTGHLTAKSDVWSYGVVLLELITGRKPIDRNRPRGEQKLLEWVRPFLSDPRKFHAIVDPRFKGQYDEELALELAEVARKCLSRKAKERPKMSEVMRLVGGIVERANSQASEKPSAGNDPAVVTAGES